MRWEKVRWIWDHILRGDGTAFMMKGDKNTEDTRKGHKPWQASQPLLYWDCQQKICQPGSSVSCQSNIYRLLLRKMLSGKWFRRDKNTLYKCVNALERFPATANPIRANLNSSLTSITIHIWHPVILNLSKWKDSIEITKTKACFLLFDNCSVLCFSQISNSRQNFSVAMWTDLQAIFYFTCLKEEYSMISLYVNS